MNFDPDDPALRNRGPRPQLARRDLLRGGFWLTVGIGAAPLVAACGGSDTAGRVNRRGPVPVGATRPSGDPAAQGQQSADRRWPRARGRRHLQYSQLRPVHGAGRHEGLRREAQRLGPGHALQQLRRDARQDPPTGRVVRPRFSRPERAEQDGLRRSAAAAQPLVYSAPHERVAGIPGSLVRQGRALHGAVHHLRHGRDVSSRSGESVPEVGYDLLWDKQYAGKVYLLDDRSEAIGMSLLRNGITTDINTSNADDIQKATDSLIELIDLVNVKLDVNAYSEVPEGTATVHQCLVGRSDRRPVLPAEGGDTRRLGLLASAILRTTSSAATTSRFRSRRRSRYSRTCDERPPRQPDRAAELRLERLPAAAHEAVRDSS